MAVFHRPLFHFGVRLILIKVAASQDLKLDLHFTGNIFSHLAVRDITVWPTGDKPNPVDHIKIEAVDLHYSIPSLIKNGVGYFVSSYEIHNADLSFSPQPSKTKEDTEQKKGIADTLNTVLGQPALYADLVRIENFNIRVNSPGGPQDLTEVTGVNILFHPWEPGYFKIERLKVPGLPAWENLAAETSYAKRNLYVRGLKISPELILQEINFDASRRAQDQGNMSLHLALFGGDLKLMVEGTKLKAKKGENLKTSYDTHVTLEAGGIDAHRAAEYFAVPNPPNARLGKLSVNFRGEPEKPHTWNGDLSATVEAIGLEQAKLDRVSAAVKFNEGKAEITGVEVASGQTRVLVKGTSSLPESINDFAKVDADVSLSLDSPSLAELTAPFMPKPVTGVAKASGTAGLHAQKATVALALQASAIKMDQAAVESVNVKLNATKALEQPPGAPATQGLDAQVSVELKGLGFGTFTADSAGLEATVDNGRITLQRFALQRAENSISATGKYAVPEPGKPAPPLNAEFSIKVPRLDSFGVSKGDAMLAGHIDGNGKVALVNGVYDGVIDITGGDFTFGDFKARKLTAAIAVVKSEANIDKVALEIDDEAQIAVAGKAGLEAPHAVEGALLVSIPKLAVLQPLLAVFDVKDKVDGAIDFSAEGQGSADKKDFTGQLKLALDRIAFGNNKLDQFRLAGNFFPGSAQTSEFNLKMGDTAFEAGIEWQENRLRLKDIVLKQGSIEALKGYLTIPFEPVPAEGQPPRDPAKWIGPIPLEKRIAATLNAKALDLEKLFATLPKAPPKPDASPLEGPAKPPVTGTLDMNLVLSGSGLKPIIHLKLEGRKLYNAGMAKLDPADLDFSAHYSERELTLDVAARQKEIQPLTIKGRIPLDLEAAINTHQLDPNLPLDLAVKLPPSSLAFLPKVVPAMRSAAGTVAIDARVQGNVQQPHFSGSTVVKLDYARMQSEGVPSIGKVDVNVAFTESAITLREFKGELGGGTFKAEGGAQFPNFTAPSFKLRLKADEILVHRDDSVTVRVDSDIGVEGNMEAAKVAGAVYVTHSRFFKDIDILPIALPGRPKAGGTTTKVQPKSAPSAGPPTLTLPPPLKNWTFDIAIKTRPDDPFKVLGNLANGAASIDLKFGGTGAEPWLDGTVRIDRLTASLPFSKLEITQGFVVFSRDAFAQPTLDIAAESQLRNYRINAFITGPATKPEVSLTSEPPLSQTDIISLIATGTTVSELTGSGNVIASRAALLLFQSISHKIFKKNPDADNSPLADRLDVDVGAADSKTGRQELSARFKLNDQLFLIGDVDIAGGFTGRVKYLLRFR